MLLNQKSLEAIGEKSQVWTESLGQFLRVWARLFSVQLGGPPVLTVDRERTTGITGVPFGRTEVSIYFCLKLFRALSHRHGPVGPSLQGMPAEKYVCFIICRESFCWGDD